MAAGRTLPATATAIADDEFVLLAVLSVELAQGVALDEERRAAVVDGVLARGYTRADVDIAAKALATDVPLAKTLRFGGAFSAADFRRLVEGDPEDKAARPLKLMSYAEANADALRRRVGIELYRPVRVAGQDKPLWTPL